MQLSQTNSSDYYDDDDSGFLSALQVATLPGDMVVEESKDEIQNELSLKPPPATQPSSKRRNGMVIDESSDHSQTSSLEAPPPSQPRQRYAPVTPVQEEIIAGESSQELEPPPATEPSLKRRRLEAFEERQRLANSAQDIDIYGASRFGGYGEYMRRKRAKLQIQNAALRDLDDAHESGIFRGLSIYVSIRIFDGITPNLRCGIDQRLHAALRSGTSRAYHTTWWDISTISRQEGSGVHDFVYDYSKYS